MRGKNNDTSARSGRFALTLVFMLLTAATAWADDAANFGGGDGSAKNPYILSSKDHWDQLSTNVAAGTDYDGKFFRLDADISVSSMLGTGSTAKNAKPFKGTFDGSGHTLTFNHTSAASEGDIAPFRFLSDATIKNLHVDGTINTANRHTGGLAGRTYRSTLIQNCRVSTTIISSVSGDGTHGGIVALKPNYTNAHLTIDGCVFDGKILTTNGTTLCAGFVGYTSYGSLTVKNSIYAPATPDESETAINSSATFYRYDGSHPGTITLTNTYYTQTLGTAQGKLANSVGFRAGTEIDVIPTGTATEYNVSGITAYEGQPCLKYDGTVYAGSGDALTLKFQHNYVGSTLTYSIGENALIGNDNDGYAVTMPSEGDLVLDITMSAPDLVNLPGTGKENDPYIIESAAVWDYIAGRVNYGGSVATEGREAYDIAYYQLSADISVTTMMGTEAHRFKGHFDGNGHKLTVSYNTKEQYTAPFRYVEGAVISNLHVDGVITTSKKFAGGLIANSKGATIENCLVSVSMASTIIGDGSHGGIVGHNICGELTITGSAFDGYMLGGRTNSCGGFVGWNETNGSPAGSVSITNCLFIPKSTAMVMDKTFARSRNYDNVHISGSYSISDYNDNQQARVYRILAGDDVTMTYAGDPATATYNISGISIYPVGLKFGDILLAREDDQMSLTLSYTGTVPDKYELSGFAATKGTLTPPSTGNTYTLTMANADTNIYATYKATIQEWSGQGSGTEESPYIISTSEEWDKFASYVNVGMGNYPTAYYKLDADISVTTMVGTGDYQFCGLFDGNGHKLTLSYGTVEAPFSEDYCAPFRYINSAEIHNLTVDGKIFTAKQFAAGIAGHADVANTIANCRVSATINSSLNGDGTHGGFVANIQSGTTTIIGSAFNGRLLGTDTNNSGGFVGWVESYNTASLFLRNCLFAPAEVTISSYGSASFARGRYSNGANISITDCYYTLSLGNTQGDLVYVSAPDGFPSQKNAIAGVDYYVRLLLIDDIAVTDITPFAATLGWTGKNTTSYSVRYRVKTEIEPSYSADFNSGIPDDWTMIDADGDGHVWELMTDMSNNHAENYAISYSYDNYDDEALKPDNWLVSPLIDLGGMLKVRLKSDDDNYPDEHFAIYLSTTGKAVEDFNVTLLPETVSTGEWQEYYVDLSDYSGQGYIAIRHFNCEDQWALLVDDFRIYSDESQAWTEQEAGTTGTTLTNLKPKTDYEYQVAYTHDDKPYYTPLASFTTGDDNTAPADIAVSSVTSNTANLSWTAFSKSYNLRYGSLTGQETKVTLYVPEDVWGDGTGYQMLLDPKHEAFGSLFDENHHLAENNGDYSATYAGFAYKIPENADGNLTTPNVISKNSVTITIPAGTYDFCVTNPTPGDRIYISYNGMFDDFVFEPGMHYTFTVRLNGLNDDVQKTEALIEETGGSAPEWTEFNGIAGTSYTLSGLSAKTTYIVQVQSVKGEEKSEWSNVLFTTADATSIGLLDDADNSGIIADNADMVRNVALVGRTLYKDGSWNTLCLPFSVSTASGTLSGDNVQTMMLNTETSNLADGTLTLNFTDATGQTIPAGTPFIIKWDNTGVNIEDPVFEGVTVSNTTNDATVEGVLTFTGTYAPVSIGSEGDNTKLYLGNSNTLHYPNGEMTIGTHRAYFQLADGITAGEPTSLVRAFALNFGNGESTGIKNGQWSMDNGQWSTDNGQSETWYTLDGRKLDGQPTQRGIYINNGKKVAIK